MQRKGKKGGLTIEKKGSTVVTIKRMKTHDDEQALTLAPAPLNDFSQTQLIQKINLFQFHKGRVTFDEGILKGQFLDPIGCCHEVSIVWLDEMDEDHENWFYTTNENIIKCPVASIDDLKKLDHSAAQYKAFLKWVGEIEIDLDKFLSLLMRVREAEKQARAARKQARLKKIDHTFSPADAEFALKADNKHSISDSFSPDAFAAILEQYKQDRNKICVVSDTIFSHAIGIYIRNDQFYVRDPNYQSGRPRIYASSLQAATEVIRCFNQPFNMPPPLHNKMNITIQGTSVRAKLIQQPVPATMPEKISSNSANPSVLNIFAWGAFLLTWGATPKEVRQPRVPQLPDKADMIIDMNAIMERHDEDDEAASLLRKKHQ